MMIFPAWRLKLREAQMALEHGRIDEAAGLLASTQLQRFIPVRQFLRQIRRQRGSGAMQRFMLWIDAVGGYLVCLNDEIVVGQAAPGTDVDVPIQADVSRRHAKILRDREGYILEPLGGKVAIDGRAITEPTLLADGHEIALGERVKLRFRKPHVLSSSARLEVVSGHRTLPQADAVILMAESCVLGPKWQSHVVCREWAADVVLYRSDDRVMCRALGALDIGGQSHDGRAPLEPGTHVVGGDFSFSIEAV